MNLALLMAAMMVAQTSAPNPTIFLKGKAGTAAAPATSAPAAPQIAKAADGKWRCVDAAGKACSEAQLQNARTVINTSRSNIKSNLAFNPDGTLLCTNAGKPCTEAETQSAAAELMKALAPGK